MGPLLYSDCELVHQHHDSQLRKIRNFMRTLVTCPDRKSFIQHVRVGRWLIDSPDATDAGVAHISMDLIGSVSASVSTLTSCPPETQRNFEAELRESSHDAMMFAILNNVPNLQSLTLDTDRIGFDPWEEIMAPDDLNFNKTLTMKLFELSTSPLLAKSHVFKTLSYLCVAGKLDSRERNQDLDWDWPDPTGWDSCLLPTFLKLPALKTFVGSGCRDWKRQGDTWPIEEGSSTVTKITLTNCELETPTVRQLLRACRSLESFECTRRGEDYYVGADLSYEGFPQDLLRHRDSLHTLHLHTKAHECDNSFNNEPVETFAGLENLKDLLVDQDALFGYIEAGERALTEILPRSLERIVIMGEPYAIPTPDDVFVAIRQALMSDKNFPAVEVRDGLPRQAVRFVRENSGVRVRKVNNEALDQGIGSFIIDRP